MIKKSIGRIEINDNLLKAAEESGLLWLNIKLHHIDYLAQLPNLHKDPCDRPLIAQAKTNHLQLLTTNEILKEYMQA